MNNTNSIKTIVVQAGQSLADIALQEYGTYEGIILVVQANPGLSVSSILVGGQELVIFTQKAISTVNEIVKSDPLGSQLRNVLMQWISLASGFVGYKIWVGTQEQRDAIAVKDAHTIYLVPEEI
jgi:hypothetical protein